MEVFQSARPRGARPPAARTASPAPCFNPRAREGRDLVRQLDSEMTHVSIRAPARGATVVFGILPEVNWFQSARPRGARLPRALHQHLPHRFNPRAREGRDPSIFGRHPRAFWFQSARPRGARPSYKPRTAILITFQSARPRGARRGDLVGLGQYVAFQSARPRGARLRA